MDIRKTFSKNLKMNNADLGISLQKFICNYFNIPIPLEAMEQFKSNYNQDYINIPNVKNTILSALMN